MDTLSLEEQRAAEAQMNTRTYIKHKYAEEEAARQKKHRSDVITQPEHYNFGIEPAEFMEALGIAEDYYAGKVIKYISRYKQKNGIEDVKKARQYCKMLLDLLETQI